MTDTEITFDNMSDFEIEESIVTKPAWAVRMIRKCFDDKHTYKGNAEALEELCKMKEKQILQLRTQLAEENRSKAKILNDLQDCHEQKALLEQQLGGAEG